MEMRITSNRTTLKTAKKYCPEDINLDVALQDKTVTPTDSEQTISPDAGYVGLSAVKVGAAQQNTITNLDLSYGEQTATYDTIDGMTISGQAQLTYSDGTTTEATKEVEIPIKPASGVNIDASNDAKSVNIGLDKTKTVLLTETPADGNNIPLYLGAQKTWMTLEATPSATASSVVTRDASGRMQAGTPVNDGDVAIKSYVDAAVAAEGPASTIVNLSAPDEATNGILTEEELAQLQASDNASIMFSHKKYDLGGKGHQEGYLTYTHAGYENNVHILESITITISTRAWVLNATDVLDEEEIKEAIQPMIPAIPTWKTTAPTTDADKAKVQFTKVTIATADETNFPGMNGRYAIVPGFTNNGFQYGTIVCSQADPAYEFPFIGSITSEMASGTIIKPSVAPTYVSVVGPEVTFIYEYLW